MADIRIVKYDIFMMDKIRLLFSDIYPGHPDIVAKLCYDPAIKDHVTTKVAYLGDRMVGQSNIFLHKTLNGNANLGFHVHPSTRMRGIATLLSREALKDAQSKGVSVFYIRTYEENFAAIAVARKLGFIHDNRLFAGKGIAVLMKQIVENGPQVA